MHDIVELKPEAVWAYFSEILAIPRISKKEDQILEYLVSFAKKQQLKYQQDQVGNLLISKSASKGMEDRKGIILQSHVDMVGEKHATVRHDFSKDPIEAYQEDGWVKARGTTLGADDGIGIAASMAILASGSIEHGPLECLFTVDEESGMTGALGLQPGFLKGTILLNLDSEDEGEIFIGCAGGTDTVATFRFKSSRVNRNWVGFRVRVDGLQGGHSGDEIHKGLGNSIKILNRFLWNADQRFKVRLSSFTGGKARNAIPREAEAILATPSENLELIRVYFESFVQILKGEMERSEPDFQMTMEKVDPPVSVMRKKYQRRLFDALYACPHGVIAMSQAIPGLVETSTNLASIRPAGEDVLEIVTSQRSSVESAKQDIADRIGSLFRLMGAGIRHSGGYPGWKPDTSSEVLKLSEKVYKELFRKEPDIKAIHAGLECGLFLQKYPQLDMVSFGPTIKGAHTPEERLQVETVERFWTFLLEMLKQAPRA